MVRGGCVYLLASKPNGVLYVGVTSDLRRRMYEHQHEMRNGFTEKYFVKKLVWYEWGDSIEGVIIREKQIKRWKRAWKIQLIEKENPEWKDLTGSL